MKTLAFIILALLSINAHAAPVIDLICQKDGIEADILLVATDSRREAALRNDDYSINKYNGLLVSMHVQAGNLLLRNKESIKTNGPTFIANLGEDHRIAGPVNWIDTADFNGGGILRTYINNASTSSPDQKIFITDVSVFAKDNVVSDIYGLIGNEVNRYSINVIALVDNTTVIQTTFTDRNCKGRISLGL